MSDIKLTVPKCFKELVEPHRYKVFWGGRGSGKSWAFALVLLLMGMSRPLRILCVRELQASIADSVHKLLADLISTYDLQGYTVTQNTIRHECGTEFIFKGLKHNLTEIKSTEGVDIVWAEEAEKITGNSWEVLIPTIRKERSEIWVSFNAKNPTDATYVRFVFNPLDDAIVKKVSYRDNPFFPVVLEKERQTLLRNDPVAYQHIWEGDFDTRYFGGVYSKQMATAAQEGRIRGNLYDPELLVHTAWDLGRTDSTVIWFYQRAGKEIRLIDFYENNLEEPPHYCGQVLGKRLTLDVIDGVYKLKVHEDIPGLERRRGYKYGEHHVPHDAAHKLFAAFGRSIVQTADACGVRMISHVASSQQNQINAARLMLSHSWFDIDHCKDGIECLSQYQYLWDDDRKVFKDKPDHNWASHAADAFELLALVRQSDSKTPILPVPRFLNEMTADELFWPQTPDTYQDEG